jgi:hypothetical protein
VWTGQWSLHAGLSGIGLMISGTLWIALLATALFIYCLPKYKLIYLADLKKMLDNLSDST